MKTKSIKLLIIAIASFIGVSGALFTLPTYAYNDVCNLTGVKNEIKEAAGCPGYGTADTSFPNLIINILNAIIGAAGLVAVIFVIIGGVNYMASSGDAGKVKKAKDTILYACIGLAICVLSFAIVNFVVKNVIKNPAEYTNQTDCENAGRTWDSTTGTCS